MFDFEYNILQLSSSSLFGVTPNVKKIFVALLPEEKLMCSYCLKLIGQLFIIMSLWKEVYIF